MKTYMVFCRESGGHGTTWIDLVEAENCDEAAEKGKASCAEAWGWDDAEGIDVIGVLSGAPTVEFWRD